MKPGFDLANGWTSEQVAKHLGVKLRTVYHHIQSGKLHPIKYTRPGVIGGAINLFDPAEVQAFVQQRVDARTEIVPASDPGPLVRQAPAPVARIPEVAMHASAMVPIRDKRYLTIEEAVAYTGCGEFHITSKVQGRPIGPRGKLVYRRAELDKL